jgi:GT2 family glycosyltransferase
MNDKRCTKVRNSMLNVSIVILTFNRRQRLDNLLAEVTGYGDPAIEVIVVNNGLAESIAGLQDKYSCVKFIQSPRNLGAAGRNLGFGTARGEFVIMLDDDVRGLAYTAIKRLTDRFRLKPRLAVVNFRVLDERTGRQINWVHHRSLERFGEKRFLTYEITEGAVAIRRDVVASAELYPESFFISHEGPDLAFRLINDGYYLEFDGKISVWHAYADEGRTSWRNYYYDTRNTYWLAVRNLPVIYGFRLVARQSMAMLALSFRDGFFKWWFRGALDGLRGIPNAYKQRNRPTKRLSAQLYLIDRRRPSTWSLIRTKLRQRDFRL